MRVVLYLIEKCTGLRDERGVELHYTVAARLTRGAAERDFKAELAAGNVRIRKLVAVK